jgi:hypothetical protein
MEALGRLLSVPLLETARENTVNFFLTFPLSRRNKPIRPRFGECGEQRRSCRHWVTICPRSCQFPLWLRCSVYWSRLIGPCTSKSCSSALPFLRQSGFARSRPGAAKRRRRKARTKAAIPDPVEGSNVSLEALPAVNAQHLAKDVARAVAAQKQNGVSNVVAIGDAAGGNARQHRLLVQASGL